MIESAIQQPPRVSLTTQRVSIKGRLRDVTALRVDDVVVTLREGIITVGTVFDAYWLQRTTLPDLPRLIEQLRIAEARPDLLIHTQRVPDTTPRFDYFFDWDNVAAVPISTHEHWMQRQISAASRRNVRMSEKKGVVVQARAFDEQYIRGIMAIANESPVRAGRRYWHYGKDFATVEAEQGTYRDRSTFLGAYVGDEQVGYLKLVWDADTAAIMQIVSKMGHRDRRPNNALLSEAVRLCAQRGVRHLLYERFVYGKKDDSSLTRFKRENGFVRMDVPRYYVPLTVKGRLALRIGLHKSVKERLPQWATAPLIAFRDRWLTRRFAQK